MSVTAFSDTITGNKNTGRTAMKLQQLKYIMEINESGSINKAAQRLYVSQPTLSMSLKELEEELGFVLFERSPHGIQVTKEGKKFIRTAEKILNQVERLQESFSMDNEKKDPAILRVSSGIYSFATEAVIRFYDNYFENVESYSLSINESSRSIAIQDVINRTADIGIIHIKNNEIALWRDNLKRRGIALSFLFKSTPCVTFRNDHPLAHFESITEDDILNFPQVRLALKNSEAYNWEDAPSFLLSEEFGRNIYTNNPGTLYDILSNTDAVFLGVTTYCITDFHPNLTTIPVPGNANSWSIYYICPENVPLSNHALNFIDTLKSIAESSSPIATTL